MVRKKTPEELKREAEGDAYIRAREKAASRLSQNGNISVKAARKQAAANLNPELQQTQAKAAAGEQVTVEEARAGREAQQTQLQQTGAFEQYQPKEISLQPTEQPEGLLGPTLGALSQIPTRSLAINYFREKGRLLEKKGDFRTPIEGAEAFPVTSETYDDMTIRELTLQDIRRENYDRGISKGEAFGSIVEAIPVVGSLARKYANGLIQTPSGNADNVIGEIRSERERAATSSEKVRSGLISPENGLEQARQMEENIAALEGRLKLLINTSPILRANTDEINKIQEEILRTKERVAQFKLASSFALTAEMSGTGRTVPTDEQLFYEYLELSKNK